MPVIRVTPVADSQRLTEPEAINLRYFFYQIYRKNFGLSTNSYASRTDMFVCRFGRTLESEAVRYAAIAYASLMRHRKVEERTLGYLSLSYAYIRKAIADGLYSDALYASYILFRCKSNIRLYHGGGEETFQHAHGLWNCCKQLRDSASAMDEEEYGLMESLCVNVFRWLYGYLDRDSRSPNARSSLRRMIEIVSGSSFVLDLGPNRKKSEKEIMFNRAQMLALYMEIYFEYYVEMLNSEDSDEGEIVGIEAHLKCILDEVIKVIPEVPLAREVYDRGFLVLRGPPGPSTTSTHEPKSFHYTVRSVWELVLRYYSAILIKMMLSENLSPIQKEEMALVARKICDLVSTALEFNGTPVEFHAIEKSIIYASRSLFLAGIAFFALGKQKGMIMSNTLMIVDSQRAKAMIDDIRATMLGAAGIHRSSSVVTVTTLVQSPDRWHSENFRDFLTHEYDGLGFLEVYSHFPRCERVWWWSVAGHLLR